MGRRAVESVVGAFTLMERSSCYPPRRGRPVLPVAAASGHRGQPANYL